MTLASKGRSVINSAAPVLWLNARDAAISSQSCTEVDTSRAGNRMRVSGRCAVEVIFFEARFVIYA